MTVASRVRHIDCEGAFNIRDLGGYPTTSGTTTRWGTLYRADGLHRISPEARSTIAQLGWRTVLDLRTQLEVDHGAFVDDGAIVVHLPVLQETWDGLFEDDGDPATFLAARYVEMLDIGAPSIAAAVEILASSSRLPAVFHCSAGKDRTGVLAALILSMLGVDDDVIAGDYHLSAGSMDRLVAWINETQPELADHMARQPRALLACPPEAMLQLLGHIGREHGSAAAYLLDIGVAPDAILACRGLLLEPG